MDVTITKCDICKKKGDEFHRFIDITFPERDERYTVIFMSEQKEQGDLCPKCEKKIFQALNSVISEIQQ